MTFETWKMDFVKRVVVRQDAFTELFHNSDTGRQNELQLMRFELPQQDRTF